MKQVFAILSLLVVILSGCSFVQPSFEFSSLDVNDGTVNFEITFNQETNVRNCRLTFVDTEGNQYNQFEEYENKCSNTYMPNSKLKMQVKINSKVDSDTEGTFYFMTSDGYGNTEKTSYVVKSKIAKYSDESVDKNNFCKNKCAERDGLKYVLPNEGNDFITCVCNNNKAAAINPETGKEVTDENGNAWFNFG